MILLDANLLIYAHDLDSPLHLAAVSWFRKVLAGQEPIALSWIVILALLRIATRPRALNRPLLMAEVTVIVDDLLERPQVRWLQAGERHWTILRRLLSEGQASGNLVMDAHLAALAIEHGALLCTTDRDFSRFPGLRWENPLQETT